MNNKRYIETKGLPFLYLLPLAMAEGNSKKPIYRIHKWWARRLSSIFRAILIASVLDESISEDDFIALFEASSSIGKKLRIFDPFVGGGTTLVEAEKLGFTLLGCEINPVAWYLTRQELSYVSPSGIAEAYERIKAVVAPKIKPLYSTTKPDGTPTDIVYALWFYFFDCPNWGFKI